jgi:hypothetical protein
MRTTTPTWDLKRDKGEENIKGKGKRKRETKQERKPEDCSRMKEQT